MLLKSKYKGQNIINKVNIQEKKCHTMKLQITKGTDTGLIYEIQIGMGAEHDFHLFKRTFRGAPSDVSYIVDLDYLGIDKIHKNCILPKKKTKNHPLTEDDKIDNKKIGADRIFIEHTNDWIKRFKILGSRVRNNFKYINLFSVLICALYNACIA